jgi:hypothetical protein
MLNQAEGRIVPEMRDVGAFPTDEVIDAYDLSAFSEEPVAKVGAYEARAPGNDCFDEAPPEAFKVSILSNRTWCLVQGAVRVNFDREQPDERPE